MKLISFIIKTVGLLYFPIVAWWIFTGTERSSGGSYFYYPELIGFFNEEGLISGSTEGLTIMLMTSLFGALVVRYIRFLSTFSNKNPYTLGKDTSETISCILDTVYIIIYGKLILSIEFMENPGWAILVAIIGFLVFCGWKISEVSMSVDREDEGAFNFRESMFNYYERLDEYYKDKQRLLTDYKNAIS